jgi:hypothetical protein
MAMRKQIARVTLCQSCNLFAHGHPRSAMRSSRPFRSTCSECSSRFSTAGKSLTSKSVPALSQLCDEFGCSSLSLNLLTFRGFSSIETQRRKSRFCSTAMRLKAPERLLPVRAGAGLRASRSGQGGVSADEGRLRRSRSGSGDEN